MLTSSVPVAEPQIAVPVTASIINQIAEIMNKKLEEILNDDFLRCETVANVENEDIKASLLKWTHDGTFSIAAVIKPTKKLTVSRAWHNENDARKYFKEWYMDVFK